MAGSRPTPYHALTDAERAALPEPLHHAKTAVELGALMVKGTDVNAMDAGGWTALALVLANDKDEVALAMLEKHGADPTVATRWGCTPLHFALNVAMVDALVKHGADVNALGQFGWTPLHRALRCRRVDVALALLKKHNADPNAAGDACTDTPLHAALTASVVDDLVAHGADLARCEAGSNFTPREAAQNDEVREALQRHEDAAALSAKESCA